MSLYRNVIVFRDKLAVCTDQLLGGGKQKTVMSGVELLTDGKSKSFWLTRLRTYSIRCRFSGHANCTGGVRVLIAVTIVCCKRNKNTHKLSLEHFTKQPISIYNLLKLRVVFGWCLTKKGQTDTYLDGLFNIILDVVNFLLLLPGTDTSLEILQ